MSSKKETIVSDHELAIDEMSVSEIEMALECALRVQGHLKRTIQKDSKVKYMNNLQIVDAIIERYHIALSSGRIAL